MKRYEYCLVYWDSDIQAMKAIDKTGIIAKGKSHLKVFNTLGNLGWRLVLQTPNTVELTSPRKFFYLERKIK